jgi:hypothetical protein
MGRLGFSGWTRGFLSRMEGEQSPRKHLVLEHATEMVQRPSGKTLVLKHLTKKFKTAKQLCP